ncbi:hypothetical protein CPB83DRAFT_858888 [Crepidotus variabilis]|uniref:Protein F37C4.5 n=1 Tax=Crepidotus variabilis TaxID=179855 RepID=A0A9P6EAI3_9AGAR|nr:hypothetical protein CPB83DRAFT_858888 [Crepidotus variabilis]
MTASFSLKASDHPIKSVTVFKSSKAEVVRTFELDLQQGQNKIEIKGLPGSIDTHSVRVSGLGDARLFDVVCAVKPDKTEDYAPESSLEVIRTLQAKRQRLETEKSIREQQSELLVQYAQTLTGEHVNPTDMGQFLENFLAQEHQKLEAITQLQEQIIQLDRQITAETDKRSAKQGVASAFVEIVLVADEESIVNLKLTYIVSNVHWTPTYELHATTENGKPSSAVNFHYRARVTQSTGEDWNNTTLTLSTITSDTFIKRIPKLRTIQLREGPLFPPTKGGFLKFPNTNANLFNNKQAAHFNSVPLPPPNPFTTSSTGGGLFGGQAQPGGAAIFGNAMPQPPQMQHQQLQQHYQQQQPQQFQQQQQQQLQHGAISFGALGQQQQAPAGATSFGQAQAPAPTLFGFQGSSSTVPAVPLPEDDFEEISGPEPIAEPATVISETPIAVSFSVQGESTIPSDGIDHQVSVAVLSFTAKISYITIPRVDPRAFLQCEVKNTSEYRLLPGPVTVIFDDSYVSKTAIHDVNTGDNFECTLGDDPSTKITYVRTHKTAKSTGGAYSEVTNTTTYTTKISVHNKHQFDIADLTVRDVIPTCEDKRAKIVLKKPVELADTKDGEMADLKNDGLKVGWESLVDGKGGEKEGKYEWKWKVGKGAKIHLESEWEVKVPGEVAWVEAYTL